MRDREIINIELGLADLASVEKRLDKTSRAAKIGRSSGEARSCGCWSRFSERSPPAGRARRGPPTEEEAAAYRALQPAHRQAGALRRQRRGGRDQRGQPVRGRAPGRARRAIGETAEVVTFSAKVEAELAELAPEDRSEFLESLGLTESGLDRLAHAAYHLLGLQSYFTAGEKEVRAWTVHRGDKAPAAAGVIHSDFEKGFIRAETVAYGDFVRLVNLRNVPRRDPDYLAPVLLESRRHLIPQ